MLHRNITSDHIMISKNMFISFSGYGRATIFKPFDNFGTGGGEYVYDELIDVS